MYPQEYRWYKIGCDRFGYEEMSEADFVVRWSEFEAHAEALKAADATQNFESLDTEKRAEMQARMKEDPFVKAVLVGMAEENQSKE